MSYGIGPTAGSTLSSLSSLQQQLDNLYAQASSGSRVNSSADDASEVAMYAALTAQATGYQQAAQNAVDATNALGVAGGALDTTNSALQQLASLATQATNDLLTPSERNDLQVEANQLLQQIDTNAQSTNFNGTQLLDGPYTSTPATPASATITANASLANGGNLAASTSTTASSQGGTIGLSVVATASGTGVNATFTSSATGQTTYLGVQSAGSTFTVDGTTVTLGGVSASDVGQTATIQVQPATVATNGSLLQVQTGAGEGSITGVSTPNGTLSGLGLGTINLSTSASATNALGQIDAALSSLGNAEATVGAQTVAMQYQQQAATNEANALTTSASDIGDANMPELSTQIAQTTTQQQVATDMLANENAFALSQANRIDAML